MVKKVVGNFEASKHFYDKVKSSSRHHVADEFVNLSRTQIANRYAQLHPSVDASTVQSLLDYDPTYMYWNGADLVPCVEDDDQRMAIIESNSCPSGQKSFPYSESSQASERYKSLLRESFLPLAKKHSEVNGGYAVCYDKNEIENTGYVQALGELVEEDVFLVCLYEDNDKYRFKNGIFQVRHDQIWYDIKAVFKYATKDPWKTFPPNSKTFIYNNIAACIAGGRNKLLANKAYELHNLEQESTALQIHYPNTIRDVKKAEVPQVVERMGDTAVIKAPYQNAGRGVYTVTSTAELTSFMETDHSYDKFIVQELIGESDWSSKKTKSHIGTLPDRNGEVFALDLRMVVTATPKGLRPSIFYVRRAEQALKSTPPKSSSWDMLGTNLSRKIEDGWQYDVHRLIPASQKSFKQTGIGMNDLVEGFVQAALGLRSIDQMSERILNEDRNYDKEYLKSVYEDKEFLQELYEA